MAIVVLRIPDVEDGSELQIDEGEAILIGRRPEVAALPEGLRQELDCLRVRLHPVVSPRVSLNHLLLCSTQLGLRVRDLQSRNGSWLRIPSTDWIPLPIITDSVLEVALTSSWFYGARPLAIPKPKWQETEEYGRSVVHCLQTWLEQQGMTAEIHIIEQPRSGDNEEHLTLPLSDGNLLRIHLIPDTTQERSFSQIHEQIASYVHEENRRFQQLCDHEPGVVFASASIRTVHERVVEAAVAGQRLMLIGPTGSGKEVLAHCLHRHSARRGGPFVTVNCALLREELLYAQLFGARRGSFTGATSDLSGLVESAHGGTLFLDELAEMDASIQSALLRFLDRRGEYTRLGDVKTRNADVQIVCATSRNLASEELRAGRFREDLWYRLAVRVVHIPALKERTEDLIAILRTRRVRGSSVSIFDAMTPSAKARVLRETWPGNFRDLDNFLQRLPLAVRESSLDLPIIERALSEGKTPLVTEIAEVEPMPSPLSQRRLRVLPLDAAGWAEVLREATQAFLADNDGPPRGWGQIYAFTERYLKPQFVARSTGLWRSHQLPEMMNYSLLARQLGVSDGTTVKSHLLRFLAMKGNGITVGNQSDSLGTERAEAVLLK